MRDPCPCHNSLLRQQHATSRCLRMPSSPQPPPLPVGRVPSLHECAYAASSPAPRARARRLRPHRACTPHKHEYCSERIRGKRPRADAISTLAVALGQTPRVAESRTCMSKSEHPDRCNCGSSGREYSRSCGNPLLCRRRNAWSARGPHARRSSTLGRPRRSARRCSDAAPCRILPLGAAPDASPMRGTSRGAGWQRPGARSARRRRGRCHRLANVL
mmetsp:Transcript_94409/g.246385  ORF Transcript_94409/g.246385 Transcript_94409/m.246385 type:complete len:217 (+) Transcript_94409:418-1068(+)